METLLLSAGFQPIDVVPWTRAVTLWFEGKARIVEEYDTEVRSATRVMKVPAVASLLRPFKREAKPVKFSRANIYARDRYRCLYCGNTLPTSELTYDHVVPRARGGKTTWLNIATCCADCNGKKACRTPAEAGMKLLKKLTEPTSVPEAMLRISSARAPVQWRDYLYWNGELEHDD